MRHQRLAETASVQFCEVPPESGQLLIADCERVDALLQKKGLWRETAEFAKLGNHVGLIRVAKFGRQGGAVAFHLFVSACQGRAKTDEPAES